MSIDKTFYIETFGCQMNFADSEIVASVLKDKRYSLVADKKLADVILINTCSIRDNAEQRVWKRLRELKSLKKKNNNLVIGIIGCMAERIKEQLLEEEQIVDLVAGPDSYRKLPELLSYIYDKEDKVSDVVLSDSETYDNVLPYRYSDNNLSAFISIMRGCENFCSYCVVPYTRGKERSREPLSILKDAEDLVDKGYKEITLLGQNVNSYNYLSFTFPALLEKVALISPMLRVRFATSHPKDLSDELLNIIATYPNICRSIHLPIQSGSNRILKMMNRKYTREIYSERISAIRNIIPDSGLSTDIITGFCSETEDDHQETLSLMEWAGFDYAYMFKYSERPDTPAAKRFKDDVPDEIKAKRLDEIISMQQKLSLNSNRNDLGKITEVLAESTSKRSSENLMGRNSQNKVVIFPRMDFKVGDYVNVKISKHTSATLFGEPI
jgi:tRNA-2-methylthio-N6-dimethylallyladenosine synthase